MHFLSGHHDHTFGKENCEACRLSGDNTPLMLDASKFVTREEYLTSQRNIRIIQWLTIGTLVTGFLLNLRNLFGDISESRGSLRDSQD